MAGNAAPNVAAIVLAAGRSRRMNSDVPKVLHDVLGVPLVEHVVRAARAVGVSRVVLVVSPDHHDAVAAALAHHDDVELAVQSEPLGTAHAVLAARPALKGFSGTALILLGDAPCVSPTSLEALLAAHRERSAALSVLSGRVADPTGYGRVVRGPDGELAAIVEEKDGSPDVLAGDEINSGTFALELPDLWAILDRVEPSRATGERYVTDAVELVREAGRRAIAVPAARGGDVLGVNDRRQLALAGEVLRERILDAHMERGVTIVDPRSTFVDVRAEIEPDARIEPFVVISGPCRVARGARIGPFAHLRGDTAVGEGAAVGSFVEVVRTTLGPGAKALHLSYLGDGSVGADVNVGAGTVFANYDGALHHRTRVEEGASLGANTVLVAPAVVGAGARTGAGAVVKGEVPAGATFVGVPARPLTAKGGTS